MNRKRITEPATITVESFDSGCLENPDPVKATDTMLHAGAVSRIVEKTHFFNDTHTFISIVAILEFGKEKPAVGTGLLVQKTS